MRTRSPDNRPRDYLPKVLHAQVRRIAAAKQYPLSSFWILASADAAAMAGLWLAEGQPGHSPLPPAVARADVQDPREVRWPQCLEDETVEVGLISAAGSSRTAVLIQAAQLYVATQGNLLTLISTGLVQRHRALLAPTAEELWEMVTGSCPQTCPLAVADTRPCWAQRLLSAHATQATPPTGTDAP